MADHDCFTWDPEMDGFKRHETAEAAQEHIRAVIEEERREASDGWNTDRLVGLCWGEIRGRVVESSRKEVPADVTLDEDGVGSDGIDYSDIPPGCDALVDYELRDKAVGKPAASQEELA